ncbi:unknown [Firmicutes bacterium CAG:646]|nr:unknown [Firmicutes bacterium CAG:646]
MNILVIRRRISSRTRIPCIHHFRNFFIIPGILLMIFRKKFHNFPHFFIGNKRSLQPGRLLITLRIIQHIAFSQKFLRPIHIQNRSGIHTRRYRKSNTGRHIGFDQTGDYIHRRSLRSDDQMKSRRSGKLRQTTDRIFHLSGSYHHKIRQLVHDNDNLRQLLRLIFLFYIFDLLHLFIVTLQIPHIVFCKFIIPLFHFCYCPVQRSGSFLRICHYRDKQMRNPIINTQLYHFWINHDQFYFFWRSLIEDAHDQRIDTYGFTGTGSSGDQKVRHLSNICHHRFSCDIFSYRECQL